MNNHLSADAPPKSGEQWLDYSDSQLPPSYDYLFVDEQYCKGFSVKLFKWKLGLGVDVCLNPTNYPLFEQ